MRWEPTVTLMFLPHFDVFYDLLLNRHMTTWNLFVLCNKETNHTKFWLFQLKMRQADAFPILTNSRKHCLLYKSMHSDWFRVIRQFSDINWALLSSMCLPFNRSRLRTNQNVQNWVYFIDIIIYTLNSHVYNFLVRFRPKIRGWAYLRDHLFWEVTNSWFAPDVMAAMLVYRTIAEKVFWEFEFVIMQNLSDILPLFCAPT